MKCQEFHSNIDGLARGALLDAVMLDDAAAHEESCADCAARLADERALTAGLRALAATMREESAPARAESALLSAFRSRVASTTAHDTAASGTSQTSAATLNVVSLSEQAGARRWSWVKTVAVAAMAAAAAVALFMLVPPYLPSPVPTGPSVAKSSQNMPAKTDDNSGTDAGQKEAAQVNDERDPSASSGEGLKPLKDDEGNASRTFTPRRAPVRALNAGYGNSTRVASSSEQPAAESADAREITTEFIPLMQDAGFAQSEGVHLVRVELPRSALSSFGIPVNAERSGGRVKADVLLGEDGTARAIRFVR
jgi:hypothetical protein